MELKEEVKGLLEDVNFNNWQWNEPEMLVLLRQMYVDLGFLDTFNIPVSSAPGLALVLLQYFCTLYLCM